MHPPIISCFDPNYDAASAQLDTIEDALSLLDDSEHGAQAKAQIRREMAQSPAKAMVNIALRRQSQTGETGTDVVVPLLTAMGYDPAIIQAHMPEAKRLYAKAILASQKALRHGRAS